MSSIIRVSHLSRDFGEIKAVSDLSFEVPAGSVYGFLGQNGAGKSTTIRMLLTLVRPTGGSIEIFGLDLYRHRNEILRRTGAVIEKPDLYKYLTSKENLRLFAAMSGVQVRDRELMEQLDMVGLAGRAQSKVKTYSQGMKQRLGIACALVHDPELIILDEPTNGLDPQGIADVRALVKQLSRELGKTLVISSHLLAEMELIADHMLIINRGRKLVEGKTAELLNPETIEVEIRSDDAEGLARSLAKTGWAGGLRIVDPTSVLVEMRKSEVPALNRALVEKGINVFSLTPKHTLEDYFLSLTKN